MSHSGKLRFPFGLAAFAFVGQLVTAGWLMVTLRDSGHSQVRDALWHMMFFPSNISDFIVRTLTHKSPVMVFGAFAADFMFGFFLDAVVWALLAALLWLLIRSVFLHQTSNPSLQPTAGRSDA